MTAILALSIRDSGKLSLNVSAGRKYPTISDRRTAQHPFSQGRGQCRQLWAGAANLPCRLRPASFTVKAIVILVVGVAVSRLTSWQGPRTLLRPMIRPDAWSTFGGGSYFGVGFRFGFAGFG